LLSNNVHGRRRRRLIFSHPGFAASEVLETSASGLVSFWMTTRPTFQ
jgi:hypothetical protein